jgi:hypothetical protein
MPIGPASAAPAATPSVPQESPIALTTASGTINGTLTVRPEDVLADPVVLLIAGSGPTDRDGNSPMLPGKNDALKQIAYALAARGIASVRYDKRGIAASAAAGPKESNLRFDMYVDDAVGWVRLLRADKRFSRITIAGHSEGSLIGMLAAVRAPADGYVSLEGAGRPAAVVLREQLDKNLVTLPELRAHSDHIIDELTAGRTVADVPVALAPAYRVSVQPYLISWFKYDPAHEIAAVRGRAAIVQGTADVQVTTTDGEALHGALPSANYVVVQGMNHVLKHAPDTSSEQAILAGYTDPTLPVEPRVIETIAAVAR